MLDPVITSFLTERKEAWLKKKINSSQAEEEQQNIKTEAERIYSFATWLPDAAKRARQLNFVTHPSKFSHPSAKTSSIIAHGSQGNDGFLRSGNVEGILGDVFGNAAAMDVYKFLSLRLQDGQTILQHLEQQTDKIKQQFALKDHAFESIHEEFMAIKEDGFQNVTTSVKVKQVYFPLQNEESSYHLLSILTPSNIMYKLKEKINHIIRSENSKQAKEDKKANKFNPEGLRKIYDLTGVGFGGANPQNISALNSQNFGVAFLLKSVPPSLKARNIRLPKTNFFSETIYQKQFNQLFFELKQVLKHDWQNNMDIRNDRDRLYKEILYKTAESVWKIRSIDEGWSTSETYQKLPVWQKYWLDNAYVEERLQNDDCIDGYIDEAIKAFNRWFLASFESYLKQETVFDDIDYHHFIKVAEGFDSETKLQLKEAFR